MTFYLALFLAFLYFKIARVYKKEEKTSLLISVQNILVALASIAILLYGVLYVEWYLFVPFIFIFATLVSFMITAIQIGVFVEGKPIFGLTHIYKYLPYLTFAIFISTFSMWFFRVFAV
ncbi:MAG: hypothetical protein PHX13_02695 [Thiovulaceae bacterium]|nr:hypothetical protein [Sulfurimonadaceae bacterium]